MGCSSVKIVAMYAGAGALLGLLIYGITAILASWCQCNLFRFGELVQIKVLFGGVLSGVFVGGSFGVFVGIGKLEDVTMFYHLGKRTNGKVLDVQVEKERADKVKDVVIRYGAYEVRVIGLF